MCLLKFRPVPFVVSSLKFRLYFLSSEHHRRLSDCADAQIDLRLCCSHRQKVFFIVWLISNTDRACDKYTLSFLIIGLFLQ